MRYKQPKHFVASALDLEALYIVYSSMIHMYVGYVCTYEGKKEKNKKRNWNESNPNTMECYKFSYRFTTIGCTIGQTARKFLSRNSLLNVILETSSTADRILRFIFFKFIYVETISAWLYWIYIGCIPM